MLCNIRKSLMLLLVIISTITMVPISSNNNAVFENWISTEIKVVKLKQTWTIKNFSFNDQKTGEKLVSPKFSTGTNDTCKWYLRLYPKGLREEYKDFVSLFLSPVSCDARAQYRLAILNAKQDEIGVMKDTYDFVVGSGLGYPKYIKQDFLLDEENEVLLNDTLTIVCELNVTFGIETVLEERIQTKLQLPHKQNYLVKDLTALLENQTFTDVVLSAGGQEFRALKAILAIRSPVFKAIFEINGQKATAFRVEMIGMKPQVLNEMLRYIYTEESPNLKHLAFDLLAAADKFELVGLKLLCEYSLTENLTVENAARYFILGDTYSARYLKNQARNFIVTHASLVANSNGLKTMIETNPRLTEELFQALTCLSHKWFITTSTCIEMQ